MEPLLEQPVAIRIHEIRKGEDQAQQACDEQHRTDEVRHPPGGPLSHIIKDENDGKLQNRQQQAGLPERAKQRVFLVDRRDPDLSE